MKNGNKRIMKKVVKKVMKKNNNWFHKNTEYEAVYIIFDLMVSGDYLMWVNFFANMIRPRWWWIEAVKKGGIANLSNGQPVRDEDV